jgi:hypothetical protein
VLSAPSLQMHSIPPRITEKSYRLRVSNRTMVGVLEPPRFACVASGPKASNHRVMKPSSRHRRLPWSVRGTSRTQSLSRSQIGLDANRHIHLLSERTEGIFFLDMSSHRTHRETRAPVPVARYPSKGCSRDASEDYGWQPCSGGIVVKSSAHECHWLDDAQAVRQAPAQQCVVP